jgi:hypothetical protein
MKICFLDRLKHLLKFKYEGKVLLILENHEVTQIMKLSDSAILQPLDTTQEVPRGTILQYGMDAQNSN